MTLYQTALSFIRRYPATKQLVKFCIVGGTSAVISFSIYFFFTAVVGWWYVFSSALGFVLSAMFNFTMNKLWTFRNRSGGKRALKQVGMFATVTTSGLFINTVIIYLLTDIVLLDWRISWVGATGLVMIWNFTFNRLWTFRHHEPMTGLSG